MPGVTQENVVPCGLHGETRCILNFIKYQLCEINKMHDQNVKETLFKKFQDFMNRRVFGCSSRPGQYTFSIDKEIKKPNMPYLQHGHCLVILDHIDEYINEIDTERPELSRIIFHNFRNAVKIMNIGIRCKHRNEPRHCCVQDDDGSNGEPEDAAAQESEQGQDIPSLPVDFEDEEFSIIEQLLDNILSQIRQQDAEMNFDQSQPSQSQSYQPQHSQSQPVPP